MGLVLIVDDDFDARFLASAHAKRLGHDVEVAVDGLEAWNLYQLRLQQSMNYDLVLTDLSMPRMDGSELIQNIRRLKPEQEIVMVTGMSTNMYNGPVPVLEKPLDSRTYESIFKGEVYAR